MKIPSDLENYLQKIIAKNKSNDELCQKEKSMLIDLRQIPQEGIVGHLNKALYGLNQTGRQWFRKLDMRLKELEFHPSLADPCIYVSKTGNEIIAVYVDDLIIIAFKDYSVYRKIKSDLMKYLEMRDLGSGLNHYIGINFSCQNEIMIANQTQYIQDILKKFKMTDCKPIGTPMDPKTELEKATTKGRRAFGYNKK